MAVSHDASTDGGNVAAATSLTWAHTCAPGATLIRVGVRSTTAAADTVTGVTYNGVALTKIASRVGDAANLRCVSLWELANPAAGAHNVVVTATTSPLQGASSSFFNALVKDAIGSGQNAAAGPLLAVSATTIAARSWVQGVFGSTQALNAGAATARRTSQLAATGGLALCDSNEAVPVPATVRNLQVTSISDGWANGAVATIVPSAGSNGSGDLGQDINTALKIKFGGMTGDLTTQFRAYLDSLSIGATKDLNTAMWHDLSGV